MDVKTVSAHLNLSAAMVNELIIQMEEREPLIVGLLDDDIKQLKSIRDSIEDHAKTLVELVPGTRVHQ